MVGGCEDAGDHAMRTLVSDMVNPCGPGLSGLVGKGFFRFQGGEVGVGCAACQALWFEGCVVGSLAIA